MMGEGGMRVCICRVAASYVNGSFDPLESPGMNMSAGADNGAFGRKLLPAHSLVLRVTGVSVCF